MPPAPSTEQDSSCMLNTLRMLQNTRLQPYSKLYGDGSARLCEHQDGQAQNCC